VTDKLIEGLKRLEQHADALMKIPNDEQFMYATHAVTSVAILDIKRCIEALHAELVTKTK
jgi:hypothetical protein